MDILFVSISLILAICYWIREAQHDNEVKQAFNEGYKKGLYTNVIRVSKEA